MAAACLSFLIFAAADPTVGLKLKAGGPTELAPWSRWTLERPQAPAIDVFSAHSLEARPVVVVIQGSKCYPVFSYREKDGVSKIVTPLIFEEVTDPRLPRVHVVAVERRGIKSFGPRPTDRPECTDAFGGVTKDDRVRDVADAVLALSQQPWARGFFLLGHSEGVDVATGVAKRLGPKYIKAVGLLSGGGPTQFFDFAMAARRSKDDKALKRVFDDMVWITSKDAEGKYNGFPIKRWRSYALASSPLDDLRDLSIPVFVAQGAADAQASVEGSDLLVLELLRNPTRSVRYVLVPDGDHDFRDAEHRPHHVEVVLDFLTWALDPARPRGLRIGLAAP